MPEPTDFEAILRTLTDNGVRFVLIGGLAMRAHGSSLLTQDMDVMYARDDQNLEDLAAAVKTMDPHLRGAPDDLPFVWGSRTLKAGQNFTLSTKVGDLDLLSSVAGVESFGELWDQSEEFELYGMPTRVASLESLLKMKLAADRPRDAAHVAEIREMIRLREAGK